ncbi:hypothetical protein I4U23_006089 [Adineta vaga]|nr:hypothetical protein I4U23_006089 [Adineta vaga]
MARLDSIDSIVEERPVISRRKKCMWTIFCITITLVIIAILFPTILIFIRDEEIKESQKTTIRPFLRMIITEAISSQNYVLKDQR